MSAANRAKAREQATAWEIDRAAGIIAHVRLPLVYHAEPHRPADLERMRDSGSPDWAAAVADAAARLWPPERRARVASMAPAGMCWLPDRDVMDRRAPGSVPDDHPNAPDVGAWSLWIHTGILAPVVRMWAAEHGQTQAVAMQAATARKAGEAWVRACSLDRERPRP